MLESDQARTLIEGAEERGYVEPAELEAFALEHDLGEDEVEQLSRELETIGLEIGKPAEEAEPLPPQPPRRMTRGRSAAPPTAFSSSSPTSAATSC